MKRIQIAVPDDIYTEAKKALSAHDLTWQKWGSQKIQEIISESMDQFGIPLTEMAVNRDQFMTKIQEKLIGILRETAFIILAQKNNQTKWIDHKQTEVDRLTMELLDIFDLETKGKWDKQKAASQAIAFYSNKLQRFVTKSMNQYKRYYKQTPEKNMSPSDLVPAINKIIYSIETDNQ